ncbi:DUF881 domain-containing protein [Brevibacterium luteolum]|uniref:DUF881 domain-containing protein n=1 Tax=Brevibacterium luteolum TaxID=199591 RepID=UPI001C23B625|nr:DUF881 domain-containing protein [Brevibacterium luteolum]
MKRLFGHPMVFIVLLICGLLMATSAKTSDGTRLRTEASTLPDIVKERSDQGRKLEESVAEQRRTVEELQRRSGSDEADDAQKFADALAAEARAAELTGEGVTVTLDDAPRESMNLPGVSVNDLVIHQQDLEGVMNALWAGGAKGMSVQGQRIVATSSVQCVGNTLRVSSQVYSPPYVIEAVGDPDALRQALSDSPAVQVYQQYAERLGLGWKVETGTLTLDAYEGAFDLSQAKVKQ